MNLFKDKKLNITEKEFVGYVYSFIFGVKPNREKEKELIKLLKDIKK